MIVVTGGAGFIGSNIIRGLNARGRADILVVDNLKAGDKFKNFASAAIADYIDKDDFALLLERRDASLDAIETVFHQGACSDTTVHDGRYMMRNNYEYSKRILELAQRLAVPMIYASSAAVYGAGQLFEEEPACEAPLNIYGYSKLLYDQRVRRTLGNPRAQIVGLRYFNVYGPGEGHKGPMASVALQLHQQLTATGRVRLFAGSGGFGDGEQRRDFVHVDDVVAVNLWFWEHSDRSGIFNVGTGQASTFNDVAEAVLRFHQRGELEYIPFPESLRGRYQSHTEADISKLRAQGYASSFRSVANGVAAYLETICEPGE